MSYGKKTEDFDSRLEKKVYNHLLHYFPRRHIIAHHPFVIREANQHFPRRRIWKPDFVLATLPPESPLFDESVYLIVEVKGKWVLKPHAGQHFKLLLELISISRNKMLDKLIIVSQDEFQVGSLKIHRYREAIDQAHSQLAK